MTRMEAVGGDAALQRLGRFPVRLRARIDHVMQGLGTALETRAEDRLEGGVLHRRSGRLAGGVTVATARMEGGIAVTLGARAPYAAYQEFGFHGTENVRAHLRTVRAAFGRPIPSRTASVRAYARRVDYPAHSFLRAALNEVAPDAVTAIEAAIASEAAT